MSEESSEPSLETNDNPVPGSKPSLEDAFAGDDGKGKLSSNLVRPKKLGISSYAEGEKDLTATSKKAKDPLGKAKAKPKEEPETTSFDPPPEEKEQAGAPMPAAKGDDSAEAVPDIEAKAEEILVDAQDPEAPPPPEKHLVEIDGEKLELTTEELIRGYQIRKASDKTFREAADLRKQNEAFLNKARDPQGVLEMLQAFGHDPKQLSEQYLGDLLMFETMTDEQKEIHMLKAEKAQREREIARAMDQQKRETAEREGKARANQMQQSIIETMEKNPDLPRDSGTIRRVIEQMRIQIKAQQHLPPNLREDVTPASVLKDVKASIENDLRTKASQMTPEQLAQYLGEEKIDEIRKWQLSKIKNPIAKKVPPKDGDQVQPQKKKRHFKTMEEFRQNQVDNGIKTFGNF